MAVFVAKLEYMDPIKSHYPCWEVEQRGCEHVDISQSLPSSWK